jgi:hypothetical protein
MVKIKFIADCGFSFDYRIRGKVANAKRRSGSRGGYLVTTGELKRIAPGQYGTYDDPNYEWNFDKGDVEVVDNYVESKRLRRQRKWDRKKGASA